ncbi:MAG TPA: homoserine dehydrogenase [Acidimicrobiales bacterium]|nr:homoserine dehydrogenase [Acidimicrobiales bacterium]
MARTNNGGGEALAHKAGGHEDRAHGDGGQAAMRVAVLGCGNVGGALVSILLADADAIAARSGVRLEVVGVAVGDTSRPRPGVPPELITGDAKGLVNDPRVDVVVELIGGVEPSRELVEAALAAGKSVVTANKELLAAHGTALAEVAAAAGVDLLYEAAVAGAIPLIRPLRESLAGERIRRVMGIVNGTTNYILTMMSEAGVSYAHALAEAQRLGYAERDPSADVDGHDAASKAAILAALAFRCEVVAADVPREGITTVDPVDIAFADRLGYIVKLLAVIERTGGSEGLAGVDGVPEISVRVHPAMLPRTHPLAAVRGAFNAVFVEGDNAGEIMLYGQGAGGRPTASAVLGDVIDAAHHRRTGAPARHVARVRPTFRPTDDLRCAWYLNIDVADRPGVLAAVAKLFGDNGVSIRSMEQVGLGDEARLIFLTHVAREGDVQRTLAGLRQLDVVDHVGGVLRVIGDEEGT